MTPRQVYDRFRADVVDTEEPFLWSDEEVIGYMEDAQQMLVRLIGGIRDATSGVTNVAIVDSTEWVDIDPSILLIRSAHLQSNHRPVTIVSWEEEQEHPANPVGWPDNWNTEMYLAGPVTAAIIGMEEEKLRLIRIPVADDTLNLVVERLPLQHLTDAERPADLAADFEVRSEHHLALLMWMKYLAYCKQDADTFDRSRSDQEMQKFTVYCAKALDEKKARNHKPRLIRYGGL